MSANSNPLLSRLDVAQRYNISVRTLEVLAYKGGGPVMTYIGSKPFYRESDVEEWLGRRRARSTSDRPKG